MDELWNRVEHLATYPSQANNLRSLISIGYNLSVISIFYNSKTSLNFDMRLGEIIFNLKN